MADLTNNNQGQNQNNNGKQQKQNIQNSSQKCVQDLLENKVNLKFNSIWNTDQKN